MTTRSGRAITFDCSAIENSRAPAFVTENVLNRRSTKLPPDVKLNSMDKLVGKKRLRKLYDAIRSESVRI